MTTFYVHPEASATITVDEPVIVVPGYSETVYSYGFEDYSETSYPAQTVYSQGFESFANGTFQPDGWVTASGSAQAFSGGPPTAVGARSLYVNHNSSGEQTTATSRTITGLVIGRDYTVSALAVAVIAGGTGSIGVTGEGASTPVNLTTSAQVALTYNFTATATSHVVTLTMTRFPGWWDNITLTRDAYTEVTNNGLDGWSNGSVVTSQKRTGMYALYANAPAKAFTGLVVGHEYTLSGWYLNGATWTEWAETFTAASTAQAKTLNLAGNRVWDDVKLVHHVPAVVDPTVDLPISQGKVRLDENYSPYITASFTVPLVEKGLLEQIDPRTEQRVTVTASTDGSADERTYDLGLRSRKVNHREQTIEIELASDEIKLHDRKHVATTSDNTARTYESSLRDICSWALDKIGATLAPGTADADLTAQWDATNLLKNPDGESSTANWTTGSSATTIALNGGAGQDGEAGFIRATQSGPTGAVFLASAGGSGYDLSAREGQMFTVSAYAKHSTAGATATITLRFLDSNNATLLNVVSSSQALPTVWGTRWSVTGVAPLNTARVVPYMSIAGSASGRTWDIDRAMMTEGPLLLDWFDGNSTDTASYTYSWEDTPNASASNRIATPERLPELFDWTPGQSLFDFLQPLINMAGLRLFCDEDRVWRLVDPAEYEVDGYVVAQTGHNATEGTDEITRNDDTWADAVVVKYTWTGPDGDTQTAYDVAGDPDGKTITREIERQYPGPGAAASILNSFKGRGRTQTVTIVGQFKATPGQSITVNLPGTVPQTGKVRAVTFDLGSGLAELETRGLTDTLPGSWALWDPEETWSEVDPDMTWNEA